MHTEIGGIGLLLRDHSQIPLFTFLRTFRKCSFRERFCVLFVSVCLHCDLGSCFALFLVYSGVLSGRLMAVSSHMCKVCEMKAIQNKTSASYIKDV